MEKRTGKKLITGIVILLILIVVLQVAAYLFLDPLIRRMLRDKVAETSHGLYALEISNFDIDIFTTTLKAEGIVLTPDTVVYHQLKSKGSEIPVLVHLHAGALQINHFSIWSAIFRRRLFIESIVLSKPELTFTTYQVSEKKHTQFDLYRSISKSFSLVQVPLVSVHNFSFTYISHEKRPYTRQKISDMEIKIEDMKIDSASQKETGRLFYAQNIMIEAKDLEYTLANGFYKIRTGSISAAVKEKSINISGFKLIPLYSKYEFGRKKGIQTDRITLSADIKFDNLDIISLVKEQRIKVENIDVARLDLSVFRDKHVLFNKKQRRKLPQQMLKELKHQVTINSFNVHNAFIQYEEHLPGAGSPGKIFFDNLNATVTNITNDSVRLLKQPVCTLKGKTRLMGTGALEAAFYFSLNNSFNNFTYEGTLGTMNFKSLNPLLENLMFAKASQGEIDKLKFRVRANDRKAIGTMEFYYHDLKVSLVDKSTGRQELKQKVGSFILNNLVIAEDNPSDGKSLRVGNIEFERDEKRFIFNYVWKTAMSGVIPSLGIKIK